MKISKLVYILPLIIAHTSLSLWGQEQVKPDFISPELSKVWESPQQLETPESVLFDEQNNCLYVSNIKGAPLDMDSNGYISKMDLKGNILNLKWATGLHAPKGMAIYKGKLYVSDINRLTEIDLKTGNTLNHYDAKKAQFLNDVTVDSTTGNVYVSDMMMLRIYRLHNGELDNWLEDEQLNRVNGLFFKDGNLYAGTNNNILEIDPNTKVINTVVDNTGAIDGLEWDGQKNWIISDWQGNIHRVNANEKEKLLSTAAQNINAADIEYIPSIGLLLVPTFNDNRVVAYQFKP